MSVLLAFFISGCSLLTVPSASHEFAAEPALAARTSTQRLLEGLPPTEKPILVSVYSFTDQTGQHKPDELPQYSRAVTQGGLAFLTNALWDAGTQGWFRVLERGGLAHLLKEREIVRTVRSEYRSANGERLSDLGPLLYSGLLLEGGIIAYESNEITGGIGARYLGIGGSSQYRRDIVTVSLRAVSVTTGEVIAAATTSKTIFSYALNGGIFKYVTFDELLEGEAGFSMNEPPQLAVRQATELAVYSLIMKGYEKGLWTFADATAGAEAYQEYVRRFDVVPRPPSATRATSTPQPTKARPTEQSANEPQRREQNTRKETAALTSAPRGPAAISSAPAVSGTKSATLRSQEQSALCHPELPEVSTDTSAGYYFQIAALQPDETNADLIRDSFLRQGLPVQLQKAVVAGMPFCRILVGPYADRSAALQQQALVAEVASTCVPAGVEPFLRELK